MNEPVGTVGIVCPEEPGLLAFVSLAAAAIAMGNTAVVVPSERQALIATDFYQVLETSDVPAGVLNIVTGERRTLGLELAKHDAVDAIWYFGEAGPAAEIETASTGNLKQVWTETVARDWYDPAIGGGRELFHHATQVKNIWIPYGE
jgi:aldehyde dehydrogenase (NAD+)